MRASSANDKPWSWAIPNGQGSDELTVNRRPVLRSFRISVNGVDRGALGRPSEVRPWQEKHFGLASGREVVVALERRAGTLNAYVFVDGLDLHGGIALEARRSQAPTPVDPIERTYRSVVEYAVVTALVAGVVGAGLAGVMAFVVSPLLALPASILGFLCGYYAIALQVNLIRLLASRQDWDYRARGTLLSLITIGPLAVFFVVISMLAR